MTWHELSNSSQAAWASSCCLTSPGVGPAWSKSLRSRSVVKFVPISAAMPNRHFVNLPHQHWPHLQASVACGSQPPAPGDPGSSQGTMRSGRGPAEPTHSACQPN
jgi:hypothetical protein